MVRRKDGSGFAFPSLRAALLLGAFGALTASAWAAPRTWSEAQAGKQPADRDAADRDAAAAVRQIGRDQLPPSAHGRATNVQTTNVQTTPVQTTPVQSTTAAGATGLLPAGDVLTVRRDDDLPTVAFDHEGRIAPSLCEAGSDDWIAVRFATEELAHELPIEVSGIEIGLDNLYGRATWPTVALTRESLTTPLQPSTTFLETIVDWADALASPTFPAATGTAPDRFERFPIALTGAPIVQDFAVDDGAWSDAFDRPIDEPLDNVSSDWLECDRLLCNPMRLLVESQTVRKTLGGDALGIKFAAAGPFAARPVLDRNLALTVDYDLTRDPMARRAGVVFRLESLGQDAGEGYVAEYQGGGVNEVRLLALVPQPGMGAAEVVMATSGPLLMPAPSGTLEVRTWGTNPVTHIEVWLNGIRVVNHDDTTYRYGGTFRGIASLGPSMGERFDNFTVRRNADVYAVLQLPAGAIAGLMADLSADSAPYDAVSLSTDGVAFTPVAAAADCVRTAGVYVALTVDDTTDTPPVDNLFQYEIKLSRVGLDCPTCDRQQSLCSVNSGAHDATTPAFAVGEPIDVSVAWWNDHVADRADLMLRVEIYEAACSALFLVPGPIASADFNPILDDGQATAGGPVLVELPMALNYTPTTSGEHCALAIEYYDTNADRCPDGWERTLPSGPCPPGCTCIPDPDHNVATGVITRDFRVERPCTPGMSNLDRNTLLLTKDAIDPSLVLFEWQSLGPVGNYNIHTTGWKRQLQDPAVRDGVPVWQEVFASTNASDNVADVCGGGATYFAVFERATCLSHRSLPDR